MSWVLVAEGALLIGTWAYHRWIEDHPKPKPSTFGVPHVDEGAAVPLIYGLCRVRSPVLAWAGSQRSIPRPNGRFAYFLDMLYVVGIPFYQGQALLRTIYAGDIALPINDASTWPFGVGSPLVTRLPFNPQGGGGQDARWNFWVDNKPARVFQNDLEITVNYGFVEFFSGSATQTFSDGVNDDDDNSLTDTQAVLEAEPLNFIYVYLNDDQTESVRYPVLPDNIQPTDIPSYRNFATCCMYHWCNGDSINLRAYSFEVSSNRGHFVASSLDGADPAEVIYDLITSPFGKLGIPESKVDLPSFQAAATALLAEGHDYSRVIEEPEDADAIINDVLRQIDGVLYEEPTTGKLVLKLIRNDYDPLMLDDVNPDNASPGGSGWYQVTGWSETMNQVRVTYTDRNAGYADGMVFAQDQANVFSQGNRIRSLDLRFVGCCSRTLADQLASRELAAVSRPIVRATLIGNRSFYSKRRGDAVTLTWPEIGVDRMVMRIADIDFGQLHQGQIKLSLIRDIFDVRSGAFP